MATHAQMVLLGWIPQTTKHHDNFKTHVHFWALKCLTAAEHSCPHSTTDLEYACAKSAVECGHECSTAVKHFKAQE